MTESKPTDFDALLEASEDDRNEEWEKQFLAAFPTQNFKVEKDTPIQGPDGWPYLLVSSGGEEPAANLLGWLTEEGVGLVLNGHKTYPDYVFTYGMLWNFRERGEFLSEGGRPDNGEIQLKPGQQVLIGEPSSEYIPDYVRNVLRSFFKDQGVEALRWAMISVDKKNYDLAISTESLNNPPEEEHQGIAEAISWFLPAHFSIAIIEEKGLPEFFNM